MMIDRSIERAAERLVYGHHVLIEEAGHDLGLESWLVGTLPAAVTVILDSI
jgi:hypothetical protein